MIYLLLPSVEVKGQALTDRLGPFRLAVDTFPRPRPSDQAEPFFLSAHQDKEDTRAFRYFSDPRTSCSCGSSFSVSLNNISCLCLWRLRAIRVWIP